MGQTRHLSSHTPFLSRESSVDRSCWRVQYTHTTSRRLTLTWHSSTDTQAADMNITINFIIHVTNTIYTWNIQDTYVGHQFIADTIRPHYDEIHIYIRHIVIKLLSKQYNWLFIKMIFSTSCMINFLGAVPLVFMTNYVWIELVNLLMISFFITWYRHSTTVSKLKRRSF